MTNLNGVDIYYVTMLSMDYFDEISEPLETYTIWTVSFLTEKSEYFEQLNDQKQKIIKWLDEHLEGEYELINEMYIGVTGKYKIKLRNAKDVMLIRLMVENINV